MFSKILTSLSSDTTSNHKPAVLSLGYTAAADETTSVAVVGAQVQAHSAPCVGEPPASTLGGPVQEGGTEAPPTHQSTNWLFQRQRCLDCRLRRCGRASSFFHPAMGTAAAPRAGKARLRRGWRLLGGLLWFWARQALRPHPDSAARRWNWQLFVEAAGACCQSCNHGRQPACRPSSGRCSSATRKVNPVR